MSRLKQLGKDSIIYGVGGILAKSVAFLLLPVFTHIFSPVEYGIIEMLTVISSFLAAIMVMGMDSAQSMYFFKVKKDGKKAQAIIITSILQWRLIWGILIIFIASLTSPLVNFWFFKGQISFKYFLIAFIGVLFAQIMSQSAEVLRLIYRPWSYIAITLSQSILSAVLMLILVILFNKGIIGFFLGAAISSVVVSIIGWFSIRDYWQFDRIYWEQWPKLISFGAPLVPAGLVIYLMSTADRWFVQHYHGTEALGIFAVGAKFSLLLTLVLEAFRKVWWPIAMDAMHNKDGPETFRMIARLYMGLATSGVIIITALSPWLVKLMTAPEFHDAWLIVGILAWQSVFYCFYMIASAGIYKTEKMYLNLYLMSGATLIGLLLNWLLVPTYGSIGAAATTAVTYFLWVIASLIVSESLWRVNFSWFILSMQIILGLLFVLLFFNIDYKSNKLLITIIAFLFASIQLITTAPLSKIKRFIKLF